MATPIFYTKNCSRFFVIGAAKYYTQEDLDANGMDPEMLGEYDPDGTSFDYESERENILNDLEAIGWEAGEGPTVATYTEIFLYGGCEISLTLKAQINSGYYEGACMDFDGTLTVYDNEDDYVNEYDAFGSYAPTEDDVIEDDWTGSAGLNKLQAKNIIKKIYSVIKSRKNDAELIFSKNAEKELYIVGLFGDGSALYQEVGKRMCEQ